VNTIVETVTATDGTSIALERIGTGAPVIPVGGAFNDRSTVAALAAALAPDFTAITTRAVADAVPGARYVTLDGQDHGVLHHPEVLGPVLSAFLAG